MIDEIKTIVRNAFSNFEEKFAAFLACSFVLWLINLSYQVVCLIFFSTANAAPTFVTPDMMYRNGLTDAQYEQLWAQGRTPQIDRGAARDWMFKSHRYANVTNWLNICGKTNDFARLSFALQQANFDLEATNSYLRSEASRWHGQYVAATNDIATLASGVFGEINWLQETHPNVSLFARDCSDPHVKAYLQRTLVPAMTNRVQVLLNLFER